MKPLSALNMAIVTLALPIGVAATEPLSRPGADLRFGPKLTIDIKAKSVVGGA